MCNCVWYTVCMTEIEKIYAFIDSQNLHLGVCKDMKDAKSGRITYKGWELDYRKFRLYLKDKYGVSKAYLFIGHVPGNEMMYRSLQEMGYILVFKPTMPFIRNGVKDVKGNVDAELVLYASAVTYHDYDKAIIVSGDGDFLCLVEYLDINNKLLKLLTPNHRYSTLLKKYVHMIAEVSSLKNTLELKKTDVGGRSKP